MEKEKLFSMKFASLYPLYVHKAERKPRLLRVNMHHLEVQHRQYLCCRERPARVPRSPVLDEPQAIRPQVLRHVFKKPDPFLG